MPDCMQLRVENLAAGYGRQESAELLFSHLDFTLAAGQSLALFGASGSGKTTLLNLIAGLLRPSDGRILLTLNDSTCLDLATAGEASRTATRRDHMGIVFQFFNLIPTLTLRENCLLPLELKGLPRDLPRVDAGLRALGLGERLDAFPETLSGGEQQRVAVLRALMHSPQLVLADEPTGNLDAKHSKLVADVLWESVDAAGASLIVATHSEALANRADAVLDMNALDRRCTIRAT